MELYTQTLQRSYSYTTYCNKNNSSSGTQSRDARHTVYRVYILIFCAIRPHPCVLAYRTFHYINDMVYFFFFWFAAVRYNNNSILLRPPIVYSLPPQPSQKTKTKHRNKIIKQRTKVKHRFCFWFRFVYAQRFLNTVLLPEKNLLCNCLYRRMRKQNKKKAEK